MKDQFQERDADKIKDRIDLADYVQGDGLTVKKNGRVFKALCPFHTETTPSFTIYEDGHYHCYGCDAYGDVINYVQTRQNLGFKDALELLAQCAGIELRPMTPEQRKEAQERRDYEKALEKAADLFSQRLLETPHGLEYAHRRGWSDELIGLERIGYANGSKLPNLGNRSAQSAAGALNSWAQGVGGALVYVHRDHGRVVYLSGRSIEGKSHYNLPEDLAGPKRPYLNACASPRADRLIIVEGQACAISLAGWELPGLALAGSGLTGNLAEQIEALVEQESAVYLVPDGDGKTQVEQIADVAGPLLHLVTLPDDVADLNAYAQNGATADDVAALLQQSVTWLDRCIDEAAVTQEDNAYARKVRRVFAMLADVSQETLDRYKKRIADRLEIKARAFDDMLRSARKERQDTNGFVILDGRLTYYGEPLGNFTALISHELTRWDGVNLPDVVYTIQGALEDGEPLPPMQVHAGDLVGLKWIPGAWGARPILFKSPGQYWLVARAIQEISCRGELKRERLHTFTGWTEIGGKRLFLTVSGGLGADGLDPTIRIDLGPNNLSRYALPGPPADPRPAIEASYNFLSLAPYEVTLPLWIAMYAAPLGEIQSLNAVLWLYGSTQTGKSTLAHLTLCHFGASFIQGHDYKAPANWLSTKTDIEGALFAAKDVPIVIDDYTPANASAGESRSLAKTAQDVIRSVGNRVARGRALPDLSARKQRPPRSLVIATAENPIVGQSTVGRMIYVPVEPGQIIRSDGDGESDSMSPSALDIAQRQAQAGLYAQAMAGYVAWLAARWDALAADLPGRIETAARAGRAEFPKNQGRLADYYGLLKICMGLAFEYFCSAGAFTRADADELIAIYNHHLIELLKVQGEQVSAQEPVSKFWQAVGDLQAQGLAHLAPNTDEPFTPPYGSELIGWTNADSSHVYLLLKPALALVKDYWESLDERFDILVDALRRALWQQGYVAERDKDQLERAKHIRPLRKSKRVLVINSREVEKRDQVYLIENSS